MGGRLALLGRLALGRSLALRGLALGRSLALRGLALGRSLLLGCLALGRSLLLGCLLGGLPLRGGLLRCLALRRSLLLGCRLPRASLCRRHCTTFLGVLGKRTQIVSMSTRTRSALTVGTLALCTCPPRSVCTCCS